MAGKKYDGYRDHGRLKVQVVTGNVIKPLRHVELHSPDGFECGYGGSGPADLALSILADHLDEKPTSRELRQGYFHPTIDELKHPDQNADNRLGVPLRNILSVRMYQYFKADVIAQLPKDQWTIPEELVAKWVSEFEKRMELK